MCTSPADGKVLPEEAPFVGTRFGSDVGHAGTLFGTHAGRVR